MTGIIILLVWVVCGVITAGGMLADIQSHWPEKANECYRRDLGAACFFSLFGPASLLIVAFGTGFFEHGLQYRRKK